VGSGVVLGGVNPPHSFGRVLPVYGKLPRVHAGTTTSKKLVAPYHRTRYGCTKLAGALLSSTRKLVES